MTSDAVPLEMSRRMVAVGDIVTDSWVRRDRSDLSELMDSMHDAGQLHPIAVGPGNRLLFGGRRLQAAKKLGWQMISCLHPQGRKETLAAVIADRGDDTCRKEMTVSELVAFGRRLENIERPKRGRPRRKDADSAAPRRRQNLILVAEALGISQHGYERARHIVGTAEGTIDSPPGVQEAAQQALARLDSGDITIYGAFKVVQQLKKADAEPDRAVEYAAGQVVKGKIFGPRPDHQQILTNLNTTLAGMCAAANDIRVLDANITPDRARHLIPDLTKSIRSLNRIRSLLEERSA